MYPEIFHINFHNFLGLHNITIYTYAVCIAIGTVIAAYYAKWHAKNNLNILLSNNLVYLIFISGFIGGKIFFYLENPLYYINKPSAILDTLSNGFVFYGSFIAIIPVSIWYLKKQQIAILPILDIAAIAITIVHSIGRLGCFGAGCCYGSPTNSSFGLVFPLSHGKSVHPTQLYESFLLFLIMISLLLFKKHKQFDGQLFLIYLGIYAFGRIFLELFRGDTRGFLISNSISHSQGIAMFLIMISTFFYYKLNKQLYKF
jgi:phosphatidylglycerol:prolipoprotein diacylglycerol transferase